MMNHGNNCCPPAGCAATCEEVNAIGRSLSHDIRDGHRDRRHDRDRDNDFAAALAVQAQIAALSTATAVGFANAQVLQLQTQLAMNEKFAVQAAALADLKCCCAALQAAIGKDKGCGCD